MNFKSIGFKAALVATVVAGSALITSSAQAFTISAGDLILQSGFARFDASADIAKGKSLNLNFGDAPFNKKTGAPSYETPTGLASATGGPAELLGVNNVVLQDLTFVKDGLNRWISGPKTSFFSINGGQVKFDLTQFILTRDPSNPKDAYKGSLIGTLVGDNSLPATGEFDPINDALFRSKAGSGYSNTTIVAIPTPALLPGLIGLGVAALRKRKSEESGVETAETAKA